VQVLRKLQEDSNKAPPAARAMYDKLRAILLQMTAASGVRRGSIRYWLSSGPGDFLLSPPPSSPPAFYGVVIAEEYRQRREGVRAVTASVPMKPPLFATMKSVNYLPNVLSIVDAEDRGAFASVWVDDEGYVAEGPMVNVAFVTAGRELVLPTFDKVLAGCTAKRMLALAASQMIGGDSSSLTSVSNRNITVQEGKTTCVEMAFVGSSLPVLPIVQWDGQPVGDGKVGPIMMALSDLLWEDMKSGPDRIPVPYASN
jgi:4-amino-4-deoxychorismate lyase